MSGSYPVRDETPGEVDTGEADEEADDDEADDEADGGRDP
jgi:hypothetical protein